MRPWTVRSWRASGLSPQRGLDPAGQLLACEVGLVHHEHVGELDLVDQEVREGAIVLGSGRELPVAEQVLGAELVEERRGVDHRHHRVQLRELAEALSSDVLEGEGDGHRERLGDPRRLDQQVVEAPRPGELGDLDEQVLTQGAADAAVGHLHQLLIEPIQRHLAAHQLDVDVELAHVVDDHRDPHPGPVVQQVGEQGGLAGAEEPRQHGHREAGRHLRSAAAVVMALTHGRSGAGSAPPGRRCRR